MPFPPRAHSLCCQSFSLTQQQKLSSPDTSDPSNSSTSSFLEGGIGTFFNIFYQQMLNYWCKNEKEKAIGYQMCSVQPFDLKLSGDMTEMFSSAVLFSSAVFLQLLFYCSLLRVKTPLGVVYKGHQCQCPLYPTQPLSSLTVNWWYDARLLGVEWWISPQSRSW